MGGFLHVVQRLRRRDSNHFHDDLLPAASSLHQYDEGVLYEYGIGHERIRHPVDFHDFRY